MYVISETVLDKVDLVYNFFISDIIIRQLTYHEYSLGKILGYNGKESKEPKKVFRKQIWNISREERNQQKSEVSD